MKEIKIKEDYLTYAQIQKIADTVCKLNTWSERELVIDTMALCYASDSSKDDIEEIGHDELLKSGLIDAMHKEIKNFNQIREAIKYTESTERALMQISKELPAMLEPLKEKVAKRANKSSKK